MPEETNQHRSDSTSAPTVFVLSGGVGSSGEQIVYTVLAQFPENKVRVYTIGNLRYPEQVDQALQQAREAGGMVVHTLVDASLRSYLIAAAGGMGVPVVDLMSQLIEWLSAALKQQPLQQPGRYRQTHREYFGRVSAIEYTLAHDDGKQPDGWPQAEIFLIGVSRSGKTPLSVYLAVLGWKVANYPLVPQIPLPPEIFSLDPNRVIGLTIDPEQLLVYRRQRQARLGISEPSDYADLETITEELRRARAIYRQGNFLVVNMTDKTIEQGADEIIKKLAGPDSATLF